jgi:glycosyltransferase involved in cell wall biosynthesis
LKILFTTDTLQRGGKERQLFVLSSNLIQRGYDISILTLKYTENNYISEYNFDSARINLIGSGRIIQQFARFKSIVELIQPDLVFSWDFQTSLFNLFFYRKFNYKFINGSIQHGVRLFRFTQFLRSNVCWLSPYIVANSYSGLKANNIRLTKNVFVLYNGIENKFYNSLSWNEIQYLRSKLLPGYIIKPGLVYISIANFVPYKDYFTVFKALKELKKEYNFYYIIIGGGPLKKEIETSINENELSENAILTGKINNVEEYLKMSDIMIHSSRGEGISNAILEGMYAGLPIIATNVGGIPETVFPNSSMLFPYKDHETLYQCLLKSDELKASFDPQSVAYRNHLEKFSVKNMLGHFEKIVESVLKEKLE